MPQVPHGLGQGARQGRTGLQCKLSPGLLLQVPRRRDSAGWLMLREEELATSFREWETQREVSADIRMSVTWLLGLGT